MILLFGQIFVGTEVSVGIKNRLYLASSRPGVTTGYSSTFVVSRITLCVIIDACLDQTGIGLIVVYYKSKARANESGFAVSIFFWSKK